MTQPREVHLVSLACATPPMSITQDEIAARLARLWKICGPERALWDRIVAGSGVSKRSAVVDPESIINATTSQRMMHYERHAPTLAETAANRTFESAGIRSADITDLIVVSCTGFSAPGVDVALVDRLGLNRSVRRTVVGFMGCFGAITGLRAAIGACCAEPGATALVVCVELCSLHVRNDPSPNNMVGAALFADGAAAAIVTSSDDRTNRIAALDLGGSQLTAHGRDHMRWQIGDVGFEMTLALELPHLLRNALQGIRPLNPLQQRGRILAVHPGGPRILDAVETAWELSTEKLDSSRQILNDFGNMSSPSVLFVLSESLRREPTWAQATLCAFGPGLSLEWLRMDRVKVGSDGIRSSRSPALSRT